MKSTISDEYGNGTSGQAISAENNITIDGHYLIGDLYFFFLPSKQL